MRAGQRATVQVGVGVKIHRGMSGGGGSDRAVGSGHLHLSADILSNARADREMPKTGLKSTISGDKPAESQPSRWPVANSLAGFGAKPSDGR
jgi:hypothetical protein